MAPSLQTARNDVAQLHKLVVDRKSYEAELYHEVFDYPVHKFNYFWILFIFQNLFSNFVRRCSNCSMHSYSPFVCASVSLFVDEEREFSDN